MGDNHGATESAPPGDSTDDPDLYRPPTKPIDLTREEPSPTGGLVQPSTAPLEETLSRDDPKVQALLAFAVVGLIVLVVASCCWAFLSHFDVNSIREFALSMFGLLSGLVGTVVGFYFGERQASTARRRRSATSSASASNRR